MVRYAYIGLDTVALVDLSVPDIQLDRTYSHNGKRRAVGHTSQTLNEYHGFDRFGRVRRHSWVDGGSNFQSGTGLPSRAPILEQSYTYDAASNRLQTLDARHGAAMTDRDTKYTYDGLHRLKEEQRGNDVSGSWTWAKDSRLWGLDMLGNWATLKFDKNNDGDYVDAGTDRTESRTHNMANELTARDRTTDSSNDDVFTLDDAGNVRKMAAGSTVAGTRYTHDAWNRLVRVESVADNGGVEELGSPPLAEYEYNGLHWRTVKKSIDEYDSGGGSVTGQDVRYLYYSAAWQLIEEHIDDLETTGGSGFVKEQVAQQFWGLRYIDDAVMRRIDANADGDFADASDRTLFHVTDVQFSSVAMIDDVGDLIERVAYDAYGRGRHRPLGDLDGDGDVDGVSGSPGTGDQALMDAAMTTYNVDADFDRDMDVDASDDASFDAAHGTAALALGAIADDSTTGTRNPVGYDGYLYNPAIEMYTVRFRHYHPEYGRWWERDPAGYVDGMSLFAYLASRPTVLIDPSGLGPADDEKSLSEAKDILGDKEAFKKFRAHIHVLKEAGAPDWTKNELLQELAEWTKENQDDLSGRTYERVKTRMSKMGLFGFALGLFFMVDDASALLAEPGSPCKKLFEHINDVTQDTAKAKGDGGEGRKCNVSEVKRLAALCGEKLVDWTTSTYGSAAGTRLLKEIEDEWIPALEESCRQHNCSVDTPQEG